MQSPDVKQTAIKTVVDVYSTVIAKVFVTCLSIMLKKMLNRVGARTQPYFTPLTERSLFNLTCRRWSLWTWITMLRNLGRGSQGTPWSSTVPFCSLCQTLWSGPQTLHTVLCFAPWISFRVFWGQTPCLWCPCWLWTRTGFLVDGLQWWWVPICLGVDDQGFTYSGRLLHYWYYVIQYYLFHNQVIATKLVPPPSCLVRRLTRYPAGWKTKPVKTRRNLLDKDHLAHYAGT